MIASLRVVALNSIGQPWSEALLEELAGYPPLLVLPGESLQGTTESPFRPLSLKGLSAEESFTRLSDAWTRQFKEGLEARYLRAEHLRLFTEKWSSGHSLLEHLGNFTVSFYAALKEPVKDVSYFAFVCRNFALHTGAYSDFAEKTTVLHLGSSLPLWLAAMNQTGTWENSRMVRYWLVNQLFLEWFRGRHPNFMSVDLEQFVHNRAEVRFNLERWFGANYDRAQRRALRELSTPPIDGSILSRLQPQADLLAQIYKDYAPYRAALSMEEWSSGFLRNAENVRLLQRYQRYWNSTSHINLDFLGPIEDELVERILPFAGANSSPNLSYTFYHQYFQVDSENPDHPRAYLNHHLGCLEEEIVFPLLPAYLRMSIAYLENLATHSPRSPRQSLFFQRLQSPAARSILEQHGLGPQLEVMEAVLESRDATPWQSSAGWAGHAPGRR